MTTEPDKTRKTRQLAYTVPDEDKGLRLLPKPKKGWEWTQW